MMYNYAKGKMGIALQSMVIGKGNIRIRIGMAFDILHTLKESDFPEELKEDWRFIKNGEVTNDQLQLIDEDKCVEIAKKIIQLNTALQSWSNS